VIFAKKFKIDKVGANAIRNKPFVIVLEGDPYKRYGESSLIIDAETCKRFGIPMSFDLVGCTLICWFESRELPLKFTGSSKKGCVDTDTLTDDDLAICSLRKIERVSTEYRMMPPAKHIDIWHTLELSSGGELYPVTIRGLEETSCPFYHITLELTEKEYQTCKALPPTSVIRVGFSIA